MSLVRPVKPDHSINEVAFVLNFSNPLSEKDMKLISEIKTLDTYFPEKELTRGVGLKVNQDGTTDKLPEKLMSVVYKKLNDNNEMIWALRIESNFIVVNCLDYSRWRNVWRIVREYLEYAASKIISPQNPLDSLTLQYVDRFIYEGETARYNTSTIFDNNSAYLNKKITESGPFWHLHQGWFDYVAGIPVRILNTLNIDAFIADKEHQTTIDHTATVQFKKKITNTKTLFTDTMDEKTAIDYYFNLLHDANKQVLKGTLNTDRLKDINLAIT